MSATAPAAGALGAALLLALSGSARAQLLGQVAANVSGGATDNALLAPDSAPAMIASDAFTMVRASVQAGYDGRRSEQTLGYAYTGTFYADHPQADGQNHDVGWRLHAAPTGRTDLRAQADASYSYLNSVNPLAATGTVNPQDVTSTNFVALPSGAASFYGLTGGATGAYAPNARFLWTEYTTVNEVLRSSGDISDSFSFYQGFGMQRARGRNALTLNLLFNYLDASGFMAADGTVVPPTEKGGVEVLGGWRHDFSASLVGNAAVGVLVTDSFLTGDYSLAPVGEVRVRYQKGFALAEAALEQTSQIDPYLGQFLLTDMLSGRAFLALDRLERFHFVGYGSAQHASILSGTSLTTAINLLIGDVGFSYRPLRYPLVASLDYNVEDQVGYLAGGTLFPSLHRQMVLLTLTGIWRSDTGLH
jgi:hypothetical protein